MSLQYKLNAMVGVSDDITQNFKIFKKIFKKPRLFPTPLASHTTLRCRLPILGGCKIEKINIEQHTALLFGCLFRVLFKHCGFSGFTASRLGSLWVCVCVCQSINRPRDWDLDPIPPAGCPCFRSLFLPV